LCGNKSSRAYSSPACFEPMDQDIQQRNLRCHSCLVFRFWLGSPFQTCSSLPDPSPAFGLASLLARLCWKACLYISTARHRMWRQRDVVRTIELVITDYEL
jgi:hypothetical protein